MKIFFFFFLKGNKKCRVGTKNRVSQVSGNTGISFLGLTGMPYFHEKFRGRTKSMSNLNSEQDSRMSVKYVQI